MKLKTLGLIIPAILASNAVVAADVYKNDTLTFSISGHVKANSTSVSAKTDGTTTKEKDFHVITSGEVVFGANYALNEDVTLDGSAKISGSDGLKGYVLSATHVEFGKLALGDTGGSFGAINKANGLEISNIYSVAPSGPNQNGIRYTKSVGSFDFSADYEAKETALEEVDGKDVKNPSNYGASVNFNGEGFTVAASYGSDGDDAQSYGFGADVTFGGLKLGAAYVDFENAGSLTVNTDVDPIQLKSPNSGETYAFTTTYTIDKLALFASYQNAEGKTADKSFDIDTYATGLTYQISDNFNTWVNYQFGEAKDGAASKEGDVIRLGVKLTF
ncbi:hypothetical protein RN22_23450 [Grimontia sp. AD028]|uniref:porin n=1 Tax=Grimontia sp. AD028 TaxID=1581149 RepID=UPI00061AD442|nr:porin [Grimontia sp. AD028]KKD58006.1 hypothetical protein RN22_23450 [Grimontia sp. AD028]